MICATDTLGETTHTTHTGQPWLRDPTHLTPTYCPGPLDLSTGGDHLPDPEEWSVGQSVPATVPAGLPVPLEKVLSGIQKSRCSRPGWGCLRCPQRASSLGGARSTCGSSQGQPRVVNRFCRSLPFLVFLSFLSLFPFSLSVTLVSFLTSFISSFLSFLFLPFRFSLFFFFFKKTAFIQLEVGKFNCYRKKV